MKIQSAGRLGNILFIWAHAVKVRNRKGEMGIVIFADKFHSRDIEEFKANVELLAVKGVEFRIDNKLGFLLRVVDKLAKHTPKISYFLRKLLRIQTEGIDLVTNQAWIQRGYFQEELIDFHSDVEIVQKLEQIVHRTIEDSHLVEKMPFLREEYQAIHVRLTDFIGSLSGVIDPNSQLSSLQDNLQVIICTDGSREDLSKRIDISNYKVITPSESTAWETIAILSGAKILVTTNSTLSWWSGFLASSRGKEVWTPTFWTKEKSRSKPITIDEQKTYDPVFE
jgi:hypothetical protein